MKSNPSHEFFDYEKNLSRLLNSPIKVDIYKNPVQKRYRKRSEDDNNFRFDFDTGKLIFMNKQRPKTPRKKDTFSFYKGRRRGYSLKNKRYYNINDLILNDIEPKDETSENPSINNKKTIQRASTFKSLKSLQRNNSLKRNRFRKKKVNFKPKLVDFIDVESYKKYNINKYLNDIGDAKCACLVY